MTIFLHELKQNSKTLLIWTAVVAGMIFVLLLIFPQMAGEAEKMTEVYANMGSFSAAFGMDRISFATPMGFYGVEAGAMIAIGGGMLAAILGGGMLAKEEGGHTAEFLFTMPISRARVVLEKMAAALVMVLLFNMVCVAAGAGGFAAIGEDIQWKEFLLYHTGQLFMQVEVALLCMGISAFLKKTSMGLAIGISMMLYFLQLFANISDKMDWLRFVTPYYYSDAAEILSTASVEWPLVALGMGYGLVALVIGLWQYSRKDLAA